MPLLRKTRNLPKARSTLKLRPGIWKNTCSARGRRRADSISEEADAQGGAKTDLTRSSHRQDEVDSLLGLVPAIKKAYPNIDPTSLIKLASQSDFSGEGQTQRQGQLSGNIAVRVKQEMPNGDLYVEGTKVVMMTMKNITCTSPASFARLTSKMTIQSPPHLLQTPALSLLAVAMWLIKSIVAGLRRFLISSTHFDHVYTSVFQVIRAIGLRDNSGVESPCRGREIA